MTPWKIYSESRTKRERYILNWIGLPLGVGVLILTVSCRHRATLALPSGLAETPLAPMLVADLGVDIIVEDIDAAQCRFDFVQKLDGYITGRRVDDQDGKERVTVEFRVPHERTARVVEILMTEFGEVSYINIFSADVSVRNARLSRELSVEEESLEDLTGTQLAQARYRIKLLRDSIEFQLERAAFLFVVVHLVEAR